jgi:dynein heavy chain
MPGSPENSLRLGQMQGSMSGTFRSGQMQGSPGLTLRKDKALSRSRSVSEFSGTARSIRSHATLASQARSHSAAQLPPLRATNLPTLPTTLRQARNAHTGTNTAFNFKPRRLEPRSESFKQLHVPAGMEVGLSKSSSAGTLLPRGQQSRAKANDDEKQEEKPCSLNLEKMKMLGNLELIYQAAPDPLDEGSEDDELHQSGASELDELLRLNNFGTEVSEDDIIAQELSRVHTGEEAIAFFAKYGSISKTKLLYCNRAEPDSQGTFAPYDLVVCPEDKVNSEYFTISKTGIVHIAPGQLSESTSLADWMHQTLMFRVLTSMNFFRLYIHRKIFTQWCTNARYEVFCNNRQRLSRGCFFSKPLFVEPLVQVHSLVHEVAKVKVLAVDTHCYTLSSFAEYQAQVRSYPVSGATSAQKEFELKHDTACGILDRLVSVVSASVEADPIAKRLAGGKSMSMVQERLEARDRARHHRVALRDKGNVGDVIRLIDYMFQASLVTSVLRASSEFSTRLESYHKLFTVSATFGERTVILEPSRDQFMDMLHNLWDGIINVVNSVQRFTTVKQYEPHIARSTSTGARLLVKEVLMSNRSFTEDVGKIEDQLNDQIDAAQVYAREQYEPYRRIHRYGQEWDEAAFCEQKHSYDDLYDEMFRMRGFREDLDNFKRSHPLGVLNVDGNDLRNELLPIAETSLSVMKRLLMNMAREKCQETYTKYDTVNKNLDERPAELSKFAAYARMFQEVVQERGDMEELMEEVQTRFQALREYDVKISTDDEIYYDNLQAKVHDFNNKKLMDSRSYIEEQRQGKREESHQKSEEVERTMATLIEDLGRGSFVDPEQIDNPHEVLEELAKIGEKLLRPHVERSQTYQDYGQLLGTVTPEPFEFKELEKANKLFADRQQLWGVVAEFQESTQNWQNSDFVKVDVEAMKSQVNGLFKTTMALSKSLQGDEVVAQTKASIEDFRERMPCIVEMGNPAMRPRHWEKIFKAVSLPWKGPNSANSVSLRMLEDHGIFEHRELVSEVSANASGEFALEKSLEQVINAWADLPLPIQNHRNQRDLWILGDLQDIITQVEDHSVSIATMMGSRFIHGIRDKVEVWEKKVNLAADVIDEWYQVQRAWMYLENIFSAEDIQKQLPTEAGKFKTVDKFWKETFRQVRMKYQNSIDAFHIPNLLTKLKWANDTLDNVQKKLEAYLETKRAAFPRFYFLSNDELLSILSQTRNPHAVQEHMCKCFDSINRVEFCKASPANIIAMSDLIKERVPFVEPVMTGPVVEKWLAEIEVAMVNGLYAGTKAALEQYPEDGTNRKEWLLQGPFAAQSQLLIDQVFWTDLAERALQAVSNGNPNAMRENVEFHNRQLANSVSMVRMNLTKLQRTLMGAIIVLDVHGITVLENLVEAKISSCNDFDWSKQLRYYWIPEDGEPCCTSQGDEFLNDCAVKQTIACFKYSYEYLGNTPRLVVTPLTDKCYMTLTGAMHLNYGGAPAGPAGTGKTETTKDLGKALAVPIIVFNCSDGLDYKIMERFFSGLAQAGAWACFDEFNRIQVEVLSVIAQQMLTVTQAIRLRKETFEFVGKEIPLNRRFGVYITMNPGYAGRAELPDNLKALFRPVAMMVPDYGLIAEIILNSEGFNAAKLLARKMVNLYRLSSEQLSKQDHYDFGMRAVKSVLVMAGHLKRQNPDLEENVTLIRALRDSNAPKFLSFDLPLFSGIISDLYPGVNIPDVDYGQLKITIEKQLRLLNTNCAFLHHKDHAASRNTACAAWCNARGRDNDGQIHKFIDIVKDPHAAEPRWVHRSRPPVDKNLCAES